MPSTPVSAYHKLLEITRYITAITEPNELFQKLINTAVEVTGAERGYLLLLEQNAEANLPLAGLRVAAACKIHPQQIEAQEFRASRTAILKVVQEGRASHWSDQFSGDWRSQSVELLGLRSILCEPLIVRERTLGVIYLDSQLSSKFNSDHVELLPSFAAQAAICLENMRLISEREEALKREHEEQSRAISLQVHKETVSTFMAIASHDLKGPLTVMHTGLALLKKQLIEPASLDILQDLKRAVERATRLVSTYLDVQKLEDGSGLNLESEWLQLKPILEEEIATAFAPLSDEKRNSFHISIKMAQETQIYADRARLGQIIGNLIDNAVKYSPKGGAITLDFTSHASYDTLSICDQGIGMSEQGRKKLFGRFIRLDQDSSIRGTGLGLFVVRMLIEAHLGSIQVSSREGQGTTFTLSFPHPDTKNCCDSE